MTVIFAKVRRILEGVREPAVDDWDPIELGLWVAKLEYAELDVEAELKKFRETCAAARKFKEDPEYDTMDLRVRAERVAKIFNELGFEGDKSNYYNLKNSFVNDVLLRRKGIPISLSLVFMGICREAGMKAVGVGFPGHFLVQILPPPGVAMTGDWRSQWYVDPFDAGKILSTADCEKRLNEWTRGALHFGPEALRVASPTEIVSRMLRNLKALFGEKEDWARLYWVLTALVELCPGDRIEAYRERGFLFARMGRYAAAAEDLKRYLGLSRDLQRIGHVERLLRFIESQREAMN